MQTIRVRTTQNVFIEYPLGSVGDRMVAFLIDLLILILYTIPVLYILSKIETGNSYAAFILLGIPYTFYSLLFEIFMNGQTPGKYLLKLKVVRLDGTPPTIGNYLMRWMLIFVDNFLSLGAIAIISITMGGKGQRLGDVLAGTSVVKVINVDQLSAKHVFVTPEEQYTPTFSQVINLTEKDIELIQRALEVNRDQGNIKPVMAVSEKIQTLLDIKTDMPPVKFLYTIIRDYQNLTAG
ncbi:RDD family protein [Chryseolinea sp. H1M3-3]|uniref:RDD family protein n=1 Tax=Chryseolinea sp. H1M3-3 TaxID=3034144 RepID=UPI0023EC4D53|nr:RDD family protein [Chryseolinea sp. H1M3-3]